MADSVMPTVATIATIGIAVSIVAMFLSRVAAVRKQAWVAARPELEPATADRMPPGFGATLACVAFPLADMGFVAAENVQGPRFSTFALWSQALFVNRVTGERASVIGVEQFLHETVTFAFATELIDGPRIVTDMEIAKHAVFDRRTAGALRLDVSGLYAQHKERVAEAIGLQGAGAVKTAIGFLPAHGDELDWLRARASVVAAGTAGKLGYTLDPNGEYYRPSWRKAARLAITTRVFPRPPGFDVAPRR